MKRSLLYIGIALAVIGCTKSEITENTPASGEISFSAGVTTRVGSGDDDCTWASGDEISIYTDQSGESNMKFTISNTSTGAMTAGDGVPDFYTLLSDTRTYYAYHHPYIADDATGRFTTSVDEKTITVDTSDDSTPLLWATATSNETDVTLQFTHALAKVTIDLTAGGVEVSSLVGATATLKGAYAGATFSIESGGFSSPSTENISLTIVDDKIVAYLIPMEDASYTVSDNVKLWITAGGDTYLYSLSTTAWKSGYEYEYDITVGKAQAQND